MILWASHLKSIASVNFELETGTYELGRRSDKDSPTKLAIPFDPKLSRNTAKIEVKNSGITVEKTGSRAPLFIEGVEKDKFELIPGQRFGVAETVFEVVNDLGMTITVDEIEDYKEIQSAQLLELTMSIQNLLDPDVELEVLGQQINEKLAAFRVGLFEADTMQSFGKVELVPSRSLTGQALLQEEPVFYQWGAGTAQVTAHQNETWALAVPVLTESTRLVLYAVGQDESDTLKREGLCLIAQILKNHLEARDSQAAKKALDKLSSDMDPRVRKAAERVLHGDSSDEGGLKVYSLGDFEAHGDGGRLDQDWGGKQLCWLLSYLLSSNRAQSEDQLREDFWPNKPGSSKRLLTVALSRLRKHLQEVFEGDPIVRDHNGCSINPKLGAWHDYREMSRLCDVLLSAEKGSVENVVEQAKTILKLNRGPYLEACYLEWAMRRRQTLEQNVQRALLEAAKVAVEGDHADDGLKFAEASLKFDECSQACHMAIMEAQIKLGQADQAIKQYESCKAILRRELDVEPSIDVFKMYQMAKLSV